MKTPTYFLFWGTATSGASAYTLPTTGGAFNLVGNSTALTTQRKVVADTRSYAITGNAATLTKTTPGVFTLNAEKGTYNITGWDVGLSTPNKIYPSVGNFVLTGNTVTFKWSGQAVWTDIVKPTSIWTDVTTATNVWTEVS